MRKAFNYAVDSKAIIENVMLGYGEAVKGVVAPSIPGPWTQTGTPTIRKWLCSCWRRQAGKRMPRE